MLFNKLDNKLRRTAREVKSTRIKIQITRMICILCVLVICILYLFSVLYYKVGQFNVTIKKSDDQKMSLALCEYQYSDNLSTTLKFDSARKITNISSNMIPADVWMYSGEHNGDNYSAFSFYVKNVGKEPATFQYSLYINQASNNIDEAVRVRLYLEDEYTNYARISSDGISPEKDTTPFENQFAIVTDEIVDLPINDFKKFTIVIWLEGDDPECVDSVLNGIFSISMDITILDIVK